MLGGLVGSQDAAERLASGLEADLDWVRESAVRFPRLLRAFFEEGDDPIISGIRRVEELIDRRGRSGLSGARNRRARPRPHRRSSEVARRDPEVLRVVVWKEGQEGSDS